MKFTGKIKNISGITISDPWYKKDVHCRYEKRIKGPLQVCAELSTVDCSFEMDGKLVPCHSTSLVLCLAKGGLLTVEDGHMICRATFERREYSLGVDTAKIYLGSSGSRAKDADYCIRTGADGMFGSVYEFTAARNMVISGRNGEETVNRGWYGVVIFFEVDAEIFSEQQMREYLIANFGIESDSEKC